MSALIVIPARLASSRYPGKPLAILRGAGGAPKTLIQRTWEAAAAARGVDRIVVATEDALIRDEAERFGGECVMTSSDCANGTERCAEALDRLGAGHDIVVNVQGDAPLTPPWFIEELVAALASAEGFGVATPVIRCDGATLSNLVEDRLQGRVGGTTAVFGEDRRALYFSKQVVPWAPGAHADLDETPVYMHAGIYAYSRAALQWYIRQPPGRLELLEGLEQLRFLEKGIRILCVEVDGRGRQFWEVNNPRDLQKVERGLAEAGIP